MSNQPLSVQNADQIEIRGCLSKPKNSPYYQAIFQWEDSLGKSQRLSRSTKRKKETEAYHVMQEMITKLQEELHTSSPDTVFVDFLQHWLNDIIIHEVDNDTTYSGYVLNMKNHIIPYFTPLNLFLQDLKPSHISQFLKDEQQSGGKGGKPLKATSVSRFYSNLKTALDYAVEQELIPLNPARMVKGPRTVKYNAKYLTIEQIAQLWQVARHDIIFVAVFLASIYGFRRGEVCGLRWENVNFRKKYLRIYDTRTRGKTEVVKGTKTPASQRIMPLMIAVEQYLRLLQYQQAAYKEFCGNEWVDSGYVLIDETGRPLSFYKLQNHYKKLLAQAGLPPVRFHDLRHSVATYLLELGIPIEEVSAWLGHSSIATTAKIYAHVNIGNRKNAARTMDKLLGYEAPPEPENDIETILSNLFRSVLEDVRRNLKNTIYLDDVVRSSTIAAEPELLFQPEIQTPFEESFEESMAAANF